MKLASLAAAILALAAPAAVLAQGETPEAPTPAARFTIDTPIETLMADERARAVVLKHFGGQDVSQHPMYEQFKAMSLKAVAPFTQGMISDAMLAAIEADLAAIK
jgi:hypothetical protein